MTIISNASPLIYLSKIRKLDLLKILFKEIIIPKEVYEEVLNKGYFDSLVIEKAVKDKWIKIIEVKIDKLLKKFLLKLNQVRSL